MATNVNKIDSNIIEVRVAEEATYKNLPATPVWNPKEPNSFTDFGGQITTTPREPFTASRQRKKGPTTDLDASAGYEQDLTQINSQEDMQGFMFADLRRKNDVGLRRSPVGQGTTGEDDDYTITDIDTTADTITVDSRKAVSAVVVAAGTGYAEGDIVEVTDANATVKARFVVTGETGGAVDTVALTHTTGGVTYNGIEGRTHTDTGAGAATTAITGGGDNALTLTLTYANALTWQAGDILFLAGNNDAANDGLKTVASVANNVITVDQNLTTDASPASTATMTTVGFEGAAGDLDVDISGAFPAITSTALDFTTLGLVPGEWIYVGGDLAAEAFSNAVNNGFKRVKSIAANTLTFDKSESTMVTEASTTEQVRLFFGRVLKNESSASLIKRRSYQIERTLGAPDTTQPAQIQSEYLTGSVANQFTLSIPTSAKVLTTMAYVSADHETRDGATGVKSGTRPALVEDDAFNSSSDVPRIKMAVVSATEEAPTALFAFLEELSVTINNNVSPNKAIGVLGAFDTTAGKFTVNGSIRAYFADVAAVAAVRANSDVTIDAHLVRDNAGMSFDLPLVALGDGRLDVVQDESIKLPLTMDAASGAKVDPAFDHTFLMVFFDYLPTAAES